jgi:predicted transcriptional regulator
MTHTFRHPKELQEAPKVSMSIRINPKTKQVLEDCAERYQLTVSAIIDAALEDWARFVQCVDKDKLGK